MVDELPYVWVVLTLNDIEDDIPQGAARPREPRRNPEETRGESRLPVCHELFQKDLGHCGT
ncbi:hypothetical protein ACIF8T_36780 [Streptomyces sp. NPDC085946]|uniref:hypothetical protein n=1 Tax=Streptomyces sp. NPDC085946 TaxID=3365744 RepID=UPI0037CED348